MDSDSPEDRCGAGAEHEFPVQCDIECVHPMRSSLYFLPQIMQQFEADMPHVALNIKFLYDESRVDLFLRGEQRILFARGTKLKRFSHIRMGPLFDSRLYIVVCRDDSEHIKCVLGCHKDDVRESTQHFIGLAQADLKNVVLN